MGFVRADIWRRYGALGTTGKTAGQIRKGITEAGWYENLHVDGTIRAETTKDVVHDIYTYKAAAKLKVQRAIFNRTKDENERKRLLTLLKADRWLEDRFLHRKMRKYFRHGVSKTANQFIVRSDRYMVETVDGRLTIIIRIAAKYGEPIRLVTNSCGKGVNLANRNLRIIVKGKAIEIHYARDKHKGRPSGEKEIGVDKGYTEALTDSDGDRHGEKFGQVLTEYSDKVAATGKNRNRLHAIENRHRKAGRTAKADRIRKNNLGRKKLNARRNRAQAQIRTIAYQAAHAVVDKAKKVVSEDLTSPISSNDKWRQYNRRMSGWAKGVLAKAIEEVCRQREAVHVIVNAAYTSQMDSFTGLLEGKRVGDKFYRSNGDVVQADFNAARNVLYRSYDPEIARWIPFQQIRLILEARSSGATERQEAPVGYCSALLCMRQRSADKSINTNAQLCASI
jgi:hypothetical protein